jgi:trans-aconitate methyltransferase
MTVVDQYFLGYRPAEQERLQEQAMLLAGDAAWLFDQVGLRAGQSVVELGCGPRGCLDLLASGWDLAATCWASSAAPMRSP